MTERKPHLRAESPEPSVISIGVILPVSGMSTSPAPSPSTSTMAVFAPMRITDGPPSIDEKPALDSTAFSGTVFQIWKLVSAL
jgi:hypothetical protein